MGRHKGEEHGGCNNAIEQLIERNTRILELGPGEIGRGGWSSDVTLGSREAPFLLAQYSVTLALVIHRSNQSFGDLVHSHGPLAVLPGMVFAGDVYNRSGLRCILSA